MPKRANKLNVYIDSDVIVASEIDTEINHKDSKRFLDFVTHNSDGNLRFYTSVFTFLELASAMIRRTKDKDKAYSLLYRIEKSWKRSIKPLAPMTSREMRSFTNLVDELIESTIRFNTPSGDTIHAHTAALFDMHYLVTWNKNHYEGVEANLKGIKVFNPSEMLSRIENTNFGATQHIPITLSSGYGEVDPIGWTGITPN